MALSLPRGGNTALTAALAASPQLHVVLEWGGDSHLQPAVDAMAFLLTASGKVRAESDMLTADHAQSTSGAVKQQKLEKTPDLNRQIFLIDFAALEPDIEKIAFCLSIHHEIGGVVSVGQLQPLVSRVGGAEEIVNSSLDLPNAPESAIVMAELYKRNGEWKFKSVGQGFAVGLSKLAESYGVTLAEEAQASGGAVSGPTKSLDLGPPHAAFEKPYHGFGEIQVTLSWSAPKVQDMAEATPAPKKGLLGGLLGGGGAPKAPPRMDLDLCALYELADGYRGVVQSLGDSLGSFNSAPFLQLMGDSRDGDDSGVASELIRINGNRWSEVKRLLIYAMIFEGTPNWAQAGGRAVIKVADQLPVSVKLDQNVNNKRACSICVLENIDGKFAIHKRVETFKNPRELDEAYGWGLQWKAGAKD
jgi:tellurite resistance protein TerA